MTTTASQPGPSRFSRIGFSLGLKSLPELRNRTSNSAKTSENEDWYIPYTGTYEAPPEPRSSRSRDRDSWGDPISSLGIINPSGVSPHVRYNDGSGGMSGVRPSEDSRVPDRARAQSITSNYTASTGMDPTRTVQGTQRRHNTPSSHRPHAPSYGSLEMGGVGESPMPQLRQSRDSALQHRGSLASIFTFGVKSPSSPVPGDHGARSPLRKRQIRPSTSTGVDRSVDRLSTDNHRRTASGDSTRSPGAKNQLQSIDSRTTTDEDYYNSYYTTLLQTPVKPRFSSSVDPLSFPDSPSTQTTSSPPYHPYAFALRQKIASEGREGILVQPKSAPPTTLMHQPPLVVPKLTFSLSNPVQPADSIPGPSAPAMNVGVPKQIKGSLSTPDLKTTLGTTRNRPKGIDRWLSAETWCDALLFPRPRLKMLNEGSRNGRIVSPPASPVLATNFETSRQVESVPSRVLAHTRSLVSLREARQEDLRHEQSQGRDGLTPPSKPPQVQLTAHASADGTGQLGANQHLRPPRPKSWASDDLDLPSPVPSLARVLAEGEKLESDRMEWQNKATGSWGNKRARNISRSRSKSLTARGRKFTTQAQSKIDFLAARAVHGNQDVIPVLLPTSRHQRIPSSQHSHSSHSRTASNSQTQTHSLIRSFTHSSKSHSRDHSRNDSWSKSAIKAVKTNPPCCNAGATITPTDEKDISHPQRALEKGPQGTEIRAARSTDSAPSNVVPSSSLPQPLGPSPTPSSTSGVTDPRVGIAISTPLTEESLDRENLRMTSHPYAQGGLYACNVASPMPEKRQKCVEYAGPHPIQSQRPPEIMEGPAARHKLPPHIALFHPYAQTHSPTQGSYDESLIHHPRPDSEVPPHAKMWAPLAPGVVREILPVDLTYSPFIDGNAKLEGDMAMAMAMTRITDTVGVGEALAYASEYREKDHGSARDSGLGTSENTHGSGPGLREPVEVGAGWVLESGARLGSPSRMPVQYDVTKMTHRQQHQHVQRSPETAHTCASTPLENQYTPRIPQFIRAELAALNSSMTASSENSHSSQRTSPRPLGSPNDLFGFQDLFYKPSSSANHEPSRKDSFGDLSLNGSQTRLSNIPFDLKSSSYQRPTSSLTNLARQLSKEYEQLTGRDRSDSQYSQSQYSRSSSGVVGSPRSPQARRPTDASLEFLFEEMPRSSSPTQGDGYPEHAHSGSSIFEPQENVPEDVHSVSSMDIGKELEESGDETVLHVKHVESATPSATDADHRFSFAGQMEYHTERPEADPSHMAPASTTTPENVDHDGQRSVLSSPSSEARVLSGLQAPLSDNTRSSYITTSTMSRMSGLSDFPVPPTNHRMSILSAFFNEINSRPSLSTSEPLPSRSFDSNNRLTFGAGADVDEIVESLSNNPKPS